MVKPNMPRYYWRRIKKKGKIYRTLPGPQVLALARRIEKLLAPLSYRIQIAGSIRRKKKDPIDIDFVLIPKSKQKIINKMAQLSYPRKLDSKGDKSVSAKIHGVDVDIYFATSQDFGAHLMTRTGPWFGNIGNRTLARNKGLKLNQYGLWKGNIRLAGRTEEGIYAALGKKYKPPERRGFK